MTLSTTTLPASENTGEIAFTKVNQNPAVLTEQGDGAQNNKTRLGNDLELSERVIDGMVSNIDEVMKILRSHQNALKIFRKDMKYFEKQYTKMEEKHKRKKRKKVGPVGFQKPVALTQKFAQFLYEELLEILSKREQINEDDKLKDKLKKEKHNKENEQLYTVISKFNEKLPKGQYHWLPRSDVSKLFSRYVAYHKLQDPEEKKYILLNTHPKGKKLKEMSNGLQSQSKITFIRIQSHIQHNYVKNVPVPEEVWKYYTNLYKDTDSELLEEGGEESKNYEAEIDEEDDKEDPDDTDNKEEDQQQDTENGTTTPQISTTTTTTRKTQPNNTNGPPPPSTSTNKIIRKKIRRTKA